MMAVFLDTVGLLALWDESDQWHASAEAAFARLLERRVPVVTTTFVMLECGNAAARRPYRHEVDRLRQALESRHELIAPTADDWQAAWQMYDSREAGDAGIVDCTSIVVMRRLALTEAFTNDHHFAAVGLTILF